MSLQDFIHRFPGPGGKVCECRVRAFAAPTGDIVAVATQLSSDPGNSIMGVAANLATIIYYKFETTPDQFLWIEHQPTTAERPETFAAVDFEWDGVRYRRPQRRVLSREELSFLIQGESLDPVRQD